MKKYDIAFLLALLLVMIAAFIVTFTYPPKATRFPFIVISISIILLATELTRRLLRARSGGLEGDAAGEKSDSGPTPQQKSVLVPLGWIALLAVMIWVLGYIISLPLYVFIYLRVYRQKWRWSILLPALMFVIVYVGFNILLEIPLYEGLLFPN